jgi:hypothetical protein
MDGGHATRGLFFFSFFRKLGLFFHSLDPLPNTHGCSGQRILETIFHGLASVNELNSCCRARDIVSSREEDWKN